MNVKAWLILLSAMLATENAQAASKILEYRPTPTWVISPPTPSILTQNDGAPTQVVYIDYQVRVGTQDTEFYSAYRVKILKPEALALGNVNAAWNPNSDNFHVHQLRIIRNGRQINVLAGTKFKVIQREGNLEQSLLDGTLTATLQIPNLQIGDELEFAATIQRRDPTLGAISQGVVELPLPGAPGVYRTRLIWPQTQTLNWRASKDMGLIEPTKLENNYVLNYELLEPKTAIIAEGAPLRFNIRRILQFSSFSNWAEVSNLIAPLYENASELSLSSPIKTEAAKISSSTADKRARVTAALKLVQEQIRYVYVALGDGNYRPATADETWNRRYADCKGKTVLLLALLRELGVPAEAALVKNQSADWVEERIPMLAAFDHVVVRTIIDGRTYWLDGTRLGDQDIELVPPPVFRWALPVRNGLAELELLKTQEPLLAENAVLLEINAAKGFDAPATVEVEQILREDAALIYKNSLAQLSNEDTDRALRKYWREKYAWVTPQTVHWRYDATQNLTVLTMTGDGKLEWQGDDTRGRALDVPNAGFFPPRQLKRPAEQDENAPWSTEFPSYDRWTTVIRLPPQQEGWSWAHSATSVQIRIGGVSYWRDAELTSGILRTTMSRRAYKPEITAEEAEEVNKKLATFDNKISRVYQYKSSDEAFASNTGIALKTFKSREQLMALAQYTAYSKRFDDAVRVFDKLLDLGRVVN